MTYTSTEAAAILKEHYPWDKVRELGYLQNKFYAMCSKRTDMGGDQEKIPMEVAPLQARSASFSVAQDLAGELASLQRAFEITAVENYALARISGKVIRQTVGKPHAFVRAVDSQLKSAFRSITRDIERDAYRDGTGALGTYASASTVTATLTNPSEAHNFEYGMEIIAAENAASTPRDSGDSVTLTGIKRQANQLISDQSWSDIGSITAGDLLFPKGDYAAANDKLKLAGMGAWIPATDPVLGSDSFYGVDRGVDVERLAGTRYDGTADTIEEALVNGQSAGAANSAQAPDYAWMNQYNVRRLINSLGSKKQYEVRRETVQAQGPNGPIGHIGFNALVIDGDEGPIRIMSVPFVPWDVCFMTKMDCWTFFSMGSGPDVLEEDGQMMLRVSNQDAYEIRIGFYGQLVCDDPSSQVRVKLF